MNLSRVSILAGKKDGLFSHSQKLLKAFQPGRYEAQVDVQRERETNRLTDLGTLLAYSHKLNLGPNFEAVHVPVASSNSSVSVDDLFLAILGSGYLTLFP